MKKLLLGKAEVTFTHKYIKDMVWSDKKESAVEVRRPVSTTVLLTVDGTEVSSTATCAVHDVFSFEKGRKVALAKAIQSHTAFSTGEGKRLKIDRARVWADYNKLKPGGRW